MWKSGNKWPAYILASFIANFNESMCAAGLWRVNIHGYLLINVLIIYAYTILAQSSQGNNHYASNTTNFCIKWLHFPRLKIDDWRHFYKRHLSYIIFSKFLNHLVYEKVHIINYLLTKFHYNIRFLSYCNTKANWMLLALFIVDIMQCEMCQNLNCDSTI